MECSAAEAVAERLRRNRLAGAPRPSSAAGVVGAVCGLQAQELAAARLSVRPRSRDLTDAGVEESRVKERAFVRTWAMRGTLHFVAADDLPWLRRLLSPGSIRANARRSAQLGLDEAAYSKALRVVDDALSGGRALSRTGLKHDLESAGVDCTGQRMVYLLARATLEGLICEGPMEGRFATYVRVQDWLHPEPRPAAERVEDLDRLVRRYLDAYGPAAPEDLAVWSGLPVPECRDAFGRAGLTRVDAGGRTMFLTGEPAGGETPRVRLLPAFDTFLLGYRDRSLHLDPAFARTVNAGGGIVKPVVLVDGRVAGTWRPVRSPKAVRLSVHPFDDLPNESLGALQVEAQDVGRFLGLRPELTVSA